MSEPFNSGAGFGPGSNNGGPGFGGSPGSNPGFGGSPAGNSFGGAAQGQPSAGFGGSTPASEPSSPGPVAFVSGPWGPVVAAAVFAVIGLILGLVALLGPFTATDDSYFLLAIAGWVGSGIFAFVLLGVYLNQDNKLRAEKPYIGNAKQVLLYRATIALAFLGVIITAVEIALWISKL